VAGQIARTPAELREAVAAALKEAEAGKLANSQAQLFEVDHVFGGAKNSVDDGEYWAKACLGWCQT